MYTNTSDKHYRQTSFHILKTIPLNQSHLLCCLSTATFFNRITVNMSEFKAQCRVFSLCSTSGWLSSWYLLHSLTVRLHAYDGFLTFAFLHKQISHFFHIRVGSGESVDMDRQTVLLWIHSYFILSSASMIFHNTQVKSWAQEWGGSEISVWMSQRCSTASEKLPVPMSPC